MLHRCWPKALQIKSTTLTACNDAVVAAIGDQPLGQMRAGLEETRARLVALLDCLTGAALAPGGAAHERDTALTRHSHEHAHALDGGEPHQR
jgi:hypothetical protein